MVTGGTGYIGSWTVQYLLESKYTVRLCVRDKSKTEKYQFLQDIATKNKATLEIHEANLLEEGSYDKIAEGCEQIFHIASPFTLKIKDAQTQFVDPALKGTRNVLNAASKSSSVTKVILTSSVAAVHGDNKDMLDQGLKYFDENHWNTTSSLSHQPYSFSKVLAEREAWKIKEQQNKWELAVINPSFVMGPFLSTASESGSLDFMNDIIQGKFATGAPALSFGFVDVRDIAKAHILAAENPATTGRHIISERCMSVMDLTKMIENEFPKKFKLPKMKAPKVLMYVLGPLFGLSAKFVSKNIGFPIALDNSKSIQNLGLKYTPINQSINEMISQMSK